MTDYSTSKYQDAETERAYMLTLDGMQSDSCGDLSEGRDWCALVALDGRCRIIREDAQGFVWTDYAEDYHGTDHARILRHWDEYLLADADETPADY